MEKVFLRNNIGKNGRVRGWMESFNFKLAGWFFSCKRGW